MPSSNTAKTLDADTIAATTSSETTTDTLGYSRMVVYFNVSNGSATAGHTLTLTIQTCYTDSDDDNDWVTLTPKIDGAYAAWTQVDGTGGGDAWPLAQVGEFTDFLRYVRARLTIGTGGTWTYDVSAILKGVN